MKNKLGHHTRLYEKWTRLLNVAKSVKKKKKAKHEMQRHFRAIRRIA